MSDSNSIGNRQSPIGNVASTAVDAGNPWPGLATFTEEQQAYFHGRDEEILDLTQLAERRPLVVLFGQSGLGKSSMLQAGVFPRLRQDGFCPAYIRLDHSPDAAPPSEQVKSIVRLETTRVGTWTRPDSARPGESLWEFFHHRDDRLVDRDGIGVVPVLVFDQFEELFTLGAARDARRDRAVAFMKELAELVENRPSAQLVARLEESSDEMEAFDFGRTDYRVIITLREDFLPDLESLKTIMPALMQKRMRLARMTGRQALDAVLKPGAKLVEPDVARAIVEFVAGARGGSAEGLDELHVEPALLSVVCRELNERRCAKGQEKITLEQVSGDRREILTDFYERSVADLPEGMRAFVEDHLLTKSGYRDNLALETALEFPGVTRGLIDTLVARRLLRIEDRLGVQRVELTHDVLAEVIRTSRDARQQRIAMAQAREREERSRRKHRVIIGGLAAAVVALLIGGLFGIGAQRRAEQIARDKAAESSRTDFIFGSRLLEDNKTPQGLAYLVRAARSDPRNGLVGPRLVSALAYRSFAEPVGAPVTLPEKINGAWYAAEGRRAVTFSGGPGRRTVHSWDLEHGRLLQSITVQESDGLEWLDVSADGRLLATGLRDGRVPVWDVELGRQLFTVRHEQRIRSLAFSPDGRWLLVASAEQRLSIWDARSGELKATLPERAAFYHFALSPDSTRFVTTSGQFRIWKLPSGEPLTPVISPGASWVDFGPDGSLIAVKRGNQQVQVYDGKNGDAIGPSLEHTGQSVHPVLSPTNTRVATNSSDGSIRIWEVPSGKLVHTLQLTGDVRGGRFTPDGRHYVVGSGDGLVHVFDVETGRPGIEPIRTNHGFWSTAMRPDGRELMTVGREGVVRRWRLTPSAIRPMEIPLDSKLLSLQRTASDGTTAWAIHRNGMHAIDLLTGRATGDAVAFPMPILGGVASPNGKFLAVRTEAQTAELWTIARGEIMQRELPVPPGRGTYPRRFSPDSAFLALAPRQSLQVIDTQTGQVAIGPLPNISFNQHYRNPSPFSPDGRYLVGHSSAAGDLRVIDLRARKVGEPIRHSESLVLVHFSPDGRHLSHSPEFGAIGIHDIASNRPMGEPVDFGTLVRGAVFSHSGKQLLTWTRLEMRLWDLASGRPLGEPMTGGVDYDPALFSPDDTRVATVATSSGEARIFDAASGTLICDPIPGSALTTRETGGFSADGRFLVTARRGGGFLVSPVPPYASGPVPEWLLRLATAIAGGELDTTGKLHDRALESREFEAIRAELAGLPNDAPYVELGRWIVADRATRPIGPGFKVTAAELEKRRTEAATPRATLTHSSSTR